MIKIYTSPSCSSCRKVKKWFDENGIPYVAKSIFSSDFTKADIKEMISKSENGTDDIISTRSKIFLENDINFDDMTISQLCEFILANPTVLKRPIIVDDHRLQVGYNEEEIRTFIPRAKRLAYQYCSPTECPHYGECEHNKDGEENKKSDV